MSPFVPCALALLMAGVSQPPPTLTLQDAVRIAVADSPRLKAARFGAQAEQAQTDRDKPVARPTVTAQAEGTLQGPRVTFPRAGDGDATVLPEHYARIALTVDQPLYHAGASAARARFSAESRAHDWEYQQSVNDLIHDVRTAYIAVLTAQAMEEVARQGVEVAGKHLDLTHTMLQAGTTAERDVRAAEADLAEAEQGAIRAANGLALARANLNRLLGRPTESEIGTPQPPALTTPPASSADGKAMALARRPELKQLEQNLAAARSGAKLAGTQTQPSLSARATAAQQTPSAFTNERYYAASLVLTWPLLGSASVRSDVAEANARIRQLEALREDARLGIGLEVEKAWRDMTDARARMEAAERQVTAAQAALDVSELRFQVRSATQLEVSGALLDVAKARASRVQAENDLRTAEADYQHATGADVPATASPVSR